MTGSTHLPYLHCPLGFLALAFSPSLSGRLALPGIAGRVRQVGTRCGPLSHRALTLKNGLTVLCEKTGAPLRCRPASAMKWGAA